MQIKITGLQIPEGLGMEVQHRDDSKRRLAGNGASQTGSTAVNTTSAAK